MDPTTAALVGAAIGAGASIIAGTLGPWVKDAIERRARARSELRSLTRNEILSVIAALSALHGVRITRPRDEVYVEHHTAAAVAITRLVLVLPERDRSELQKMLGFALDTISSSESRPVMRVALQSAAWVLEEWFRGSLRGSAVGDAFARTLEAGGRDPA